jgi:hypothetical protein
MDDTRMADAIKPNSNFRSWFYDQDAPKEIPMSEPEQKFYDVVGIKLISLKSFVSWLLLKGAIRARDSRGISITEFPIEKKIYYLIVNVPNIKKVADEFNKAFSNIR